MSLARRTLLLLAAFSLAAQPPPKLDDWVERARKQFEIPGIAVAIVKDGAVVAAKGFGVRKLESPAKVDAHTLFGIASNTKAFTTAALAILIDEKKLKWDDKVIDHLPSFALSDPWVTRELTIRDLVSHRSGLGLGAGDLMYWPDTTFTREQVLQGARHLKSASSFRSKYAYNNLLFVVAGQVVAAVSGQPYEQFLQTRILKPLQMGETRISNAGVTDADNVAVPHSRGWRLEGTLRSIPLTRDHVWAAAAGLKANVTDLAKWLNVQLAQGAITEKQRLFSEDRSREMFSPQTIINVTKQPPALAAQQAQFAAYGLGWNLRDYRGNKVAAHGGALAGMVSLTTLLPSQKLGVVVLSNQEESAALLAITNHILDFYLHTPSPDWIGAIHARTLELRKKDNEREQKALAARNPGTQPSLPLLAYAQTYRDPWYGQATFTLENGRLSLRMHATPAMVGHLEHFQHNTFIVRFNDITIPDAYCNFLLDNQGKIASLKMEAVSDLADFSFDYHNLEFTPEAPKP